MRPWRTGAFALILSIVVVACGGGTATVEEEPAEPVDAVAVTAATALPPTEELPTATVLLPTEPPATAEPTTTPTATAEAITYLGLPQGTTEDGVPTLGLAEAPLVFTDYSDFLCTACQRYVLEIEPQIIEAYVRPGQVRMAFRPVLNHGERSVQTAAAAACAAEQEQFWAMHQILFERQNQVWQTAEADMPELMASYAVELELDEQAFRACVDQGEAHALVQSLDAEQRSRGITAQPTFEIGNQRLIGFQPFEVLQRVIETTAQG